MSTAFQKNIKCKSTKLYVRAKPVYTYFVNYKLKYENISLCIYRTFSIYHILIMRNILNDDHSFYDPIFPFLNEHYTSQSLSALFMLYKQTE